MIRKLIVLGCVIIAAGASLLTPYAYKWQFTYLGANQDAFAEAGSIGIPQNAAMNYGEEKTAGAILASCNNVSRMRSASATGASILNVYTDKERQESN